MNDEKMTEAMARLEFAGRDVEFSFPAHRPRIAHITIENGDLVARNYLTSHDAVIRVIDGLGDVEQQNVWNELFRLKSKHAPMTATPRQKVEAILKALGLWEDG